ncbi:MAG TPA: hypothetical protein VF062_05430 [Candidatus Limnocylindrales bacterium]
MRRLIAAACAVVLLTLSTSATAGADPSYTRFWESPAHTAPITSCVTGNSGGFSSMSIDDEGAKIRGFMRFCRDDGGLRYFGIEFFTDFGTVGGFFAPFFGDKAFFEFVGKGFERVSAVCLAPAPDDRVACAKLFYDPLTHTISLEPLPVTHPLVSLPSDKMYFCDDDQKWIHPNCSNCLDPDHP